jgi:tetratricopeptide (TPR) repeat protein
MDAVMGRVCTFITLAFMLFCCASFANAGVYSTVEPKWKLSRDHISLFQAQTLTPLKQLASPEAKDLWQKYEYLVAIGLLAAKDPPPRGQPDNLTPEERLDLGACLLRIRYPGKQMPEKAIAILNAGVERDRDNFLIMSTLGTANLMAGEYQRAGDWLSEANRYWGKPWDKLDPKQRQFLEQSMGWKPEDFAWFSKCEQFQRQLVRLRSRELRKGPLTLAKALERLDPLFDSDPKKPLRFIGESGKPEVGKIAAAEKAKLPPDAIEIVEQLLVWTPDDLRLYWLLGELFNAEGDVDSARIVYEELLGKYAQSKVQDAFAAAKVNKEEFYPKFVVDYPEVGGRLKALRDYVPPTPQAQFPSEPTNDKDTINKKGDGKKVDDATGVPLKLDWQTLGVGLGGGLFAGFVLAWRIRDRLGRRK